MLDLCNLAICIRLNMGLDVEFTLPACVRVLFFLQELLTMQLRGFNLFNSSGTTHHC